MRCWEKLYLTLNHRVSVTRAHLGATNFTVRMAKMCINCGLHKSTFGFVIKNGWSHFSPEKPLNIFKMWFPDLENKCKIETRMHFHHTFWHWICHKWVFRMHFIPGHTTDWKWKNEGEKSNKKSRKIGSECHQIFKLVVRVNVFIVCNYFNKFPNDLI